MKKKSALIIFLELIVIIGTLTSGATMIVCRVINQPITRTLVGLILLAFGLIGILEFFTYRIETKLKSVQNIFACVASIIVGLLFLILNIDPKIVCIIWGSYAITLSLIRVSTSIMNFLKQPLLHITRLINSTLIIVFSVIFLVQLTDFLVVYFTFFGIIFALEAVVLLIEFLIHRYQR